MLAQGFLRVKGQAHTHFQKLWNHWYKRKEGTIMIQSITFDKLWTTHHCPKKLHYQKLNTALHCPCLVNCICIAELPIMPLVAIKSPFLPGTVGLLCSMHNRISILAVINQWPVQAFMHRHNWLSHSLQCTAGFLCVYMLYMYLSSSLHTDRAMLYLSWRKTCEWKNSRAGDWLFCLYIYNWGVLHVQM